MTTPPENLPWEANYVPPVADQTLIDKVVPSVTPEPIPAVTVPPPGATAATPAWITDIEALARTNAEAALLAALPNVQGQIASLTDAALTELVKQMGGGTTNIPAPPPLQNFAEASARSRAIRSFLIGLGMTILMGLATTIGSLTNINWFSTSGWISVGTLAVGSIISSVVSYVARLKWTPSYITNSGTTG